MGRPRTRGPVVARETICIVVGARPPVYVRKNVYNVRKDQWEEIDINPEQPPVDEGDDGIPYTFKAGEKVRRDHPAVKQSPHAFVELEDAEEMNLEQVR